MLKAMLGTKIKQSQTFTDAGKRIPVTYISVGPCWITAMNTVDGQPHIQLGFGVRKSISKPLEGHIKKAGIEKYPRFFREVPSSGVDDMHPGQEIHADEVFSVGDSIRVTGISKGKGFAGVMKRHGFHGGPATHGQSDRARSPGSIGQTTTPGRVYRGKRMAGRMGQDTVTVRGLKVISIDKDRQMMIIQGLIPGGKNNLVVIQKES